MLTHVLHQQLHQPWVRRWLRRILPARPDEAEVDAEGNLRFTFPSKTKHELVVWDVGRCIKLLRRASPDVATELLYRLCWLYDDRQETSERLRHAMTERLGCHVEPAVFHWSLRHDGVLTTAVLKGRRRSESADEIVLRSSPLDDDAVYCLLKPSAWLCDILLDHLIARAVKGYRSKRRGNP